MPVEVGPSWVQIWTLVAATIAALGPLVSWMQTLRAEREKFNLHIEWVYFDFHDYTETAPYLFIHNSGSNSIIVTSIIFRTGLFILKKRSGTALEYEDPMDLNFPYEVASGQQKKLMIQVLYGQNLYKQAGWKMHLSRLLKRSYLWLEVETAASTVKRIQAEAVLPWEVRPRWTKIED